MLSTKSDARSFWLRPGFASDGHLFPTSAGAKAAGVIAFVLLAIALDPSTAAAQCAPPTGTVSCTGSPGPQAFTQPPVDEVDYSGLISNIAATGPGQAGAQLTANPSPGGNGTSLPISGTDGSSGNNAGDVVIQFAGPSAGFVLSTTNGIGLNAQSNGSAGGKGGDGFSAFPLPGFGADGGQGGTGGSVDVTTTGLGLISTGGDNNHAIEALSTGGHGGNGGGGETILSSFGGGGDGGAGGAPGTATVSNVLSLTTSGNGAAGIWAQSVGAAGGDGGTVGGCIVCSGGSGAAASSGQTVQVTNSGVITTGGSNAVGIFAQSVGGFAGSGGGSFGLFSFGGNPSSAGAGGQVTVTTTGGSITTTGNGSTAIFAQSVGGGGGTGGAGGGLVGFGGAGSQAETAAP
jgi:hypothetical protein